MKKFFLIYHGYEQPSLHREIAWNGWFKRREASFVEPGSLFGPGRRITQDATVEFELATNPASGYSIVSAAHIDAAEQLLEGCPFVDSVTLYEALLTNGTSNFRTKNRGKTP